MRPIAFRPRLWRPTFFLNAGGSYNPIDAETIHAWLPFLQFAALADATDVSGETLVDQVGALDMVVSGAITSALKTTQGGHACMHLVCPNNDSGFATASAAIPASNGCAVHVVVERGSIGPTGIWRQGNADATAAAAYGLMNNAERQFGRRGSPAIIATVPSVTLIVISVGMQGNAGVGTVNTVVTEPGNTYTSTANPGAGMALTGTSFVIGSCDDGFGSDPANWHYAAVLIDEGANTWPMVDLTARNQAIAAGFGI